MTTNKKATSNVIIYTRVSSERQLENMSLGEQEKLCRDYCARRDFTVIKHFEERAESAKTAQRSQLQSMLDYCSSNKKDIQAVIVYKIDRFARNMSDHMALRTLLKRLDIQLLSVTEPISETNSGVLLENMLASFAQFDNDVRGERARIGLHARSQEGCWVCLAPTGYANMRDELNRPTLVVRESMRKPITQFFEKFATGKYSQAEAVHLAFSCGIRTNKGAIVSKNGVIKMLKSIVYAGYVQGVATDNKRIKGLHEAYISLETYEAIQAILAGRGRPDSKPHSKNLLYPLKRLLVCSQCRKSLTASSPKGRSKHYESYHCSRCTKKRDGATVNIPRDLAHQLFTEGLSDIRPSPWVPKVFKEIVLRRWNEDFKEAQNERRNVEKQLQALDDKKAALVDKLIAEVLSDDTYRDQEARLTIQRGELALRLDGLKEAEIDKERIVDESVNFLFDLPKIWERASIDDKQRFQNAIFMSEIIVYPNRTFGTAKISAILEETTEIEKFVTENKIDLSAEKSIMAAVVERSSNPVRAR